jgi:hypothetical protein
VIDAQIQKLLNAGELQETADHLMLRDAAKMA